MCLSSVSIKYFVSLHSAEERQKLMKNGKLFKKEKKTRVVETIKETENSGKDTEILASDSEATKDPGKHNCLTSVNVSDADTPPFKR